MKRAVGYIRVSTDRQADSGASLEVQESKVRAMAEVQGVELVEIIVDPGESAKDLNRPGMARLLDHVELGDVQTVIVYKLDRLTRSVRDLGELLDRFEHQGVALVSVSESLDTGSAAGRLVLHVMASVGQWERETVAERTREVLQAKKARGQRVGNLPFGYRVNGDGTTLEQHPVEQRILGTMRRLRTAGNTLREIAGELNRKGFTTRTGAPWKVRKVHHLLTAAVQ